ncbi:MAG: hypothetical protein KBG47_02110 [Bacteroidia bacterium]|nr:hypothetical protein [Sphingobacteriaceae bacterium]MBP9068272.1 hypothetical protein [Bacteroidia bacterium]
MKKTSLLFFIFASLLSYSQKKETITVKKQSEIFFYRTGEFKDGVIIKDSSDVFYLDIPNDLKPTTDVKLINASFLKTSDPKRFKLIYTKGMRYQLIYVSDNDNISDTNRTFEVEIAPDGASGINIKDITIEFWNIKTNKRILKNVFTYKEK